MPTTALERNRDQRVSCRIRERGKGVSWRKIPHSLVFMKIEKDETFTLDTRMTRPFPLHAALDRTKIPKAS
jgi:hypothetical protein